MYLDIYWIAFLALIPTVILLVIVRPLSSHICTRWRRVEDRETSHLPRAEKAALASALLSESATATTPTPASKHDEASHFIWSFLTIYLLTMSSEWLSGPYLYSLLRHDRGIPESIVSALYATTYTSAAISALVVGFLADRYGRRNACLVQCVVHSAACLTVVLGGDCLPVLFVGRVLAGTGLTLLWTVFESWMVTEWNTRGLEGADGVGSMGRMFGLMTTANCGSAIVGGCMGHLMIRVLGGSNVWPFWTGIILEGVAATLMLRNMNENYGIKHEERKYENTSAPEISGRGRLGDGRIWALTLVTCCFEGTNFLVVFFWPSVLQDAHDKLTPDASASTLPYGVIFASFMAAMIIGTLLFSSLSDSRTLFQNTNSNAVRVPVCLLLCAVMLAGVCLLWLSLVPSEAVQFATFLVFEVANGVYVPSIAYIRGLVIDDKSRAGMYGLMRIPLFVFVILALGINAEDNRSRRFIFVSASCCLLLAILAVVFGFRETLTPPVDAAYVAQEDLEDTPENSTPGEYKEKPNNSLAEVWS